MGRGRATPRTCDTEDARGRRPRARTGARTFHLRPPQKMRCEWVGGCDPTLEYTPEQARRRGTGERDEGGTLPAPSYSPPPPCAGWHRAARTYRGRGRGARIYGRAADASALAGALHERPHRAFQRQRQGRVRLRVQGAWPPCGGQGGQRRRNAAQRNARGRVHARAAWTLQWRNCEQAREEGTVYFTRTKKYKLESHIACHHRNRQFLCKFCGQAFSRASVRRAAGVGVGRGRAAKAHSVASERRRCATALAGTQQARDDAAWSRCQGRRRLWIRRP